MAVPCLGPGAGSSCGWAFPGPELAPCGLPPTAGIEGTGIPPLAGPPPCPGMNADCAGVVLLQQCKALCEASPACNAVSWGADEHDCYLKSNPGACDHVAADTFCPFGVGSKYQHHMRCPCGSASGTFKNGLPKLVDCPAWGGPMLLVLFVVGLVYVGLGYGYSWKVSGELSHPHRVQWRELAGLVSDGVGFTRGRLGGDSGGGLVRHGDAESSQEPLMSESDQ